MGFPYVRGAWVLTSDGERGRRLHFAHPVFSQTGEGALIPRRHLLDPQHKVLLLVLHLVPAGGGAE